jgi:3-aminobutyryl-CoA ammonia-lyase
MRLRMAPSDARYADGLVDGGRILQLLSDLATEMSIVTDGDEGLFRAYDNVEFLAPVRSGDFIEATATLTSQGRTSRRIIFEVRRRITMTPERGSSAGVLLPDPEVVLRASGTVVVPLDLQHDTAHTDHRAASAHTHPVSPFVGKEEQS